MSEPKQRPGRSKQDYGTPPEFLAAARSLLQVKQFDCDLAASDENTVVRRCYYTKDSSSLLLRSWLMAGGWNWLNPPFSKIAPWVERANREWRVNRVRTAVLIPAAVGSNWWRDHVDRKCLALFLNGRLKFVGAKDLYPKDCALLLYGPPAGYRVWTWKPSRTIAPGGVSTVDAEILSSSAGTRVTGASESDR